MINFSFLLFFLKIYEPFRDNEVFNNLSLRFVYESNKLTFSRFWIEFYFLCHWIRGSGSGPNLRCQNDADPTDPDSKHNFKVKVDVK